MVPVIIGGKTTAAGNVVISANIAATSFGKVTISDMLEAAIEKENAGEVAIFGANKKITLKLPYPKRQLFGMGNFNAIHNINDKNSPVKLKIQKNTDSLQFKRWFDHSKVIDVNGEPLVVYHGTDWQGRFC